MRVDQIDMKEELVGENDLGFSLRKDLRMQTV